MSKNDRYAKIAALRIRKAWREGAARLSSAPRSSIASAEQALRARRRRRILVTRVVPIVATSMALGGALLVWSSFAHRPRGQSLAIDARALMLFGAAAHGGAPSAGERPLGPGDQVFAPRTSPVKLGDAGGTELTLEPGGTLTVLEASTTRRFALRRGAVGARVRKLVAGERFIIETADAEIEVHGTQFRVSLGEPENVPCLGPGPRDAVATRVSVTEGVVSVKWAGDEQRLHPGDEWPPRCAPASASARPAPAAPSMAAAPVALAEGGVGPAAKPASAARATTLSLHRRIASPARTPRQASSTPAPAGVARAPLPEIPASVLAAQNDLFVSAVRARRAGRAKLALSLFDRFLQEYPEASLFESALAQKMRLLAAVADRAGAAGVARQYLGRFPDGFARDEASSLVATPDRR